MFNAIDEVKRQYTYAVQPVQLLGEQKNSKAAQTNSFDFINKISETGNNPFHPDVSNSEKGSRLDIMG